MERILSDIQCRKLISHSKFKIWERVDRYGTYSQIFIDDEDILNSVKNYFKKEITANPILKILKLSKGDNIPIFSADYSNQQDEYYKRYIGTNFIIQTYLNSDFEGGIITKKKQATIPKPGYGITQNKTEKCSISKVEKGTAFFLFVFISKIKTVSLL